MAVETTNALSGPFLTNGATTTFPFTFTAPSAAEVGVILRDANGVETDATGYTVNVSPGSGGSVVFAVPPPAGFELLILLDPAFTQQIEFENGSAWLAEPVNEVADRSAARDQVLKRDLARSILVPLGELGLKIPSLASRIGKYLAFGASGIALAASGTGNDPNFRTDLAQENGAEWIGVGNGRSQADLNAEVVSVLNFIPPEEHAGILAGTSTYDCTADIQAAIAAVDGTGLTLRFPGGTYVVSQIHFLGSYYFVDTSAAWFREKDGTESGGVILISEASDLTFGDFYVTGNIDTGSGESNHAVNVGKASNIRIGRIFGENIRGDALYCYARNTSDAERLSNLYVEAVSGTNVYRNLLTVTGGQVRVGAVINAGPVGYRDFDVEPNNASGTYEAADLEIGYVKAGCCEITSDDAAVINHSVRIGVLDCDRTRVQPTSTPYPTAPGAGAYALGISRTESVHIGYFKARNYNVYPISLAFAWSVLDIGTLDIANCSLTDTTYNTMILQQGNAQGGCVRIGTLICDAAATKYLARVAGSGLLKIDVANIRLMECMPGVAIEGRFANGTINLNGGDGFAFVNCGSIVLENVTTANGGSSTGFYQCDRVKIVNSTVTFGTLDGGGTGSNRIVAVNSSVNGSTADGVDMVRGGAVRVAGTKVLGAQGAAIADAGLAAGANPTKAEFDTLVASHNALLARARAHGWLAT